MSGLPRFFCVANSPLSPLPLSIPFPHCNSPPNVKCGKDERLRFCIHFPFLWRQRKVGTRVCACLWMETMLRTEYWVLFLCPSLPLFKQTCYKTDAERAWLHKRSRGIDNATFPSEYWIMLPLGNLKANGSGVKGNVWSFGLLFDIRSKERGKEKVNIILCRTFCGKRLFPQSKEKPPKSLFKSRRSQAQHGFRLCVHISISQHLGPFVGKNFWKNTDLRP